MALINRYFGGFITLLLFAVLFYFFSDVLSWIAIAWVISLLGAPLLHLLGRPRIGQWRLSRTARALLVLMIFYGAAATFFVFFTPPLLRQARNLAGVDYQEVMQSLDEPLSRAGDWLVEHNLMRGELSQYYYRDNPSKIPPRAPLNPIDSNTKQNNPVQIIPIEIPLDSVNQLQVHIQLNLPKSNPNPNPIDSSDTRTAFEALKTKVASYLDVSGLITGAVAYLLGMLSNLFITLTSVSFIAFFFLKDDGLFGRGIKRATPDRYADKVDTALSEIKQMLTRYFGAILLQITLITIYTTTLLGVLGIPNAMLIGFFAALINVIPYVGPIIGAAFAIVLTLGANVDAEFYSTTLPAIWTVGATFLSMQLLDNFLLQPMIFSKSVKAHPIEIFFVVIAGAKISGITGMVLAIPTYTIFRVIASVFLYEFDLIQKIAGTKTNADNE